MHWPTQGQWWSKRSTQLLQIEQWEQRGGRYSMQVSQYLTFTVTPFTLTSFVRGKRNCCGVWPFPVSMFTSLGSGSGGWVLRGTIPGSLPEVRSSSVKSWKMKGRRFRKVWTLPTVHIHMNWGKNRNINFILSDQSHPPIYHVPLHACCSISNGKPFLKYCVSFY